MPRVWVLLGKGTGGNAQMISLADALGWPYETKELVFNRLQRCPNLLLGASRASVDAQHSSPLVPPWPDLVIGGSRRSAPVARWIKRRAGTTRLVHLMHTQAPLAHFDLVITSPQYRLPERANVLHNTVPLNRVPHERIREGAEKWATRLAHLPSPRLALLVGGDSSSYRLEVATAAQLGREVSARVRDRGGSLLVTTSARTPAAAVEALRGSLDGPVLFHRWRPKDPENPYFAFLGLADQFVVTIDSASLIAEACATGKSVEVFRWPVRTDRRRGLRGLARRLSAGGARRAGPLLRLYAGLVYLGLVKPPRDLEAYVQHLRARGFARFWGEPPPPTARQPLDDLERAVRRIRDMMSDCGASAEPAEAMPGQRLMGPTQRRGPGHG